MSHLDGCVQVVVVLSHLDGGVQVGGVLSHLDGCVQVVGVLNHTCLELLSFCTRVSRGMMCCICRCPLVGVGDES